MWRTNRSNSAPPTSSRFKEHMDQRKTREGRRKGSVQPRKRPDLGGSSARTFDAGSIGYRRDFRRISGTILGGKSDRMQRDSRIWSVSANDVTRGRTRDADNESRENRVGRDKTYNYSNSRLARAKFPRVEIAIVRVLAGGKTHRFKGRVSTYISMQDKNGSAPITRAAARCAGLIAPAIARRVIVKVEIKGPRRVASDSASAERSRPRLGYRAH